MNNAVARGLTQRGIDVTNSRDANLIGASDQQQLAYAISTGRVLVTHDDDLLSIAAAEGVEHSGIALCHSRGRTIGGIVHGLVNLWGTRSAESMQGQTVFI